MMFLLNAAAAQSVVGTWHGRFSVDTSKLPKVTDLKQKQLLSDGLKRMHTTLGRAVMTLTLKGDKTYRFVGENLPGPNKSSHTEGTYAQVGNTLTLTTKKENGKPPKGEALKPHKLTVEGSHLVRKLEGAGQVRISIIFGR